MADSLAEKLRKRKEAMEAGDPTGGEAFDPDRPDKGNIRKKVEGALKVEGVLESDKGSRRRRKEAQSTDSNQ